MPFYIRDLSIFRFWYPRLSWNHPLQILKDDCNCKPGVSSILCVEGCLRRLSKDVTLELRLKSKFSRRERRMLQQRAQWMQRP